VALATQDDAASYGVVDEVTRRVLLSGGRVLAVRRDDLPERTPLAAICVMACEPERWVCSRATV
jgi:hypothetical protein